jgi:hypothetical protein
MGKTPIPVPGLKPDEAGHLMMLGTDGNLDYIVIARVGDVVLGLKPNSISEGPNDTTYIGCRLRAASAKGVFPEEANIHSIAAKSHDFGKAFPAVEWEKTDATRASTQICAFLEGSIRKQPEKVLKDIEGGKIGDSMVGYLATLIPEQHMLLSKEALAAWISSKYEGPIKRVKQKMEEKKIVEQNVGEHVGTFGIQTQMMRKLYKGTQTGDELEAKAHFQVPDAPAEEASEPEEEGIPNFAEEPNDEE